MMPQIVEIVKNIHNISEVQSLGVAVDIGIEAHTHNYIGVSEELRAGLLALLATFKTNSQRQPDLRALIPVIEKYLKLIDEWIRFPKII